MEEKSTTALARWLIPLLLVAGIAISLFAVLRLVDYALSHGHQPLLEVFFLSNPEDVASAIGGLSEVLVAILGLVVTVVAIVVQLAAQRYTPKLVDLFVIDRVNIAYFVLMVVASLYSVLIVYSSDTQFLPFWGSLSMVAMTTLIIGLLIPYFNHVFRFLTPENIIRTIRGSANKAMLRTLNQHIQRRRPLQQQQLRRHQKDVANAMEQISDIALSAVSQMDRDVSLRSIRTLKNVMIDHLLIKHRMPPLWFVPQKEYFPAISTDFLHEIEEGHTWVEVKGFMDMELIFKQSMQEMPDAVSAIANITKIIGQYAIRLEDSQVLHAAIRYFNTFLRVSVNSRNPRAIYNLFYQYRLLAEEVLSTDESLAERICFYFKYYGQVAQQYNIPLILVTAAFDMANVLQTAYDRQSSNIEGMLALFLELDDSPVTQANEFDLRSVRKAQLKFASFLLSRGDDTLVLRIADDMKHEPWERLQAIRDEQFAVTERKFWEVTDRGVDFFYMDEGEKEFLNLFYTRYLVPQQQKLREQSLDRPA